MPDLRDGETAEVWSSGSQPYRLKNVGGVYSCSCPAWRNQSLPIDRRSCKHLRSYRSAEAESVRVGAPSLPDLPTPGTVTAPALLLAESWNEGIDPTGWLISEKLDGVRAWWDGKTFCSRNGNPIFAPEWFTHDLPPTPLDGELWVGRKQFQRTVSIVRRSDGNENWREVRYLVFDAPAIVQPFEQRLEAITDMLQSHRPQFAQAVAHIACLNRQHLADELARVETLGGEGLMLRSPGSYYAARRSDTLLKVKSFLDCEATIVGHQPGKGRHRGRLGALLVKLSDGTPCKVGTGLTDAQRDQPPPIGAVIILKYQELTDGGVPRFPVFAGLRTDISIAPTSQMKGNRSMSKTPTFTSQRRRFEFVQGTSNKFWEISVQGTEVFVNFGRIGTSGQSNNKSFTMSAEALKHAEKLIRSKTAKGYIAA